MSLTDMTIVHRAMNDAVLAPAIHSAATGAIVASMLGYLTPIVSLVATALAAVWYGITIYESKTGQAWVAKLQAWRHRNKAPGKD